MRCGEWGLNEPSDLPDYCSVEQQYYLAAKEVMTPLYAVWWLRASWTLWSSRLLPERTLNNEVQLVYWNDHYIDWNVARIHTSIKTCVTVVYYIEWNVCFAATSVGWTVKTNWGKTSLCSITCDHRLCTSNKQVKYERVHEKGLKNGN